MTEIDPTDLRIDVFRNEAEAHVKITHLPTGTVATGHDPQYPASSLEAKAIAMRGLADKLKPEPEPAVHAYLSTACQHALHDACRYFCKYCPAPCQCGCHEGATGPYAGYDAASEDRLRQELRDAVTAAGIEPGPRQAELLVDIVTSVLAGIARDRA